ncbi:MAG: hypothetical protein IKQ91_08315 [Oscillospiraceae bacterium]|nr:hypothetical protein [Oscillospiraceae bacterium]
MDKNIHSGHRNRMRARFCATGFSGFQPHEVLELILFYGIPRKDTNEIAHRLLERFGSLHAVLSAKPEDTEQITGMTHNAAVLLSVFREVYRFDADERLNGTVLNSYSKVCDFFAELYRFEETETVRAAMLDENLRVIRCEIIAEGHPSAAQFTVRQLNDAAFRAHSNLLVLAHNHPSGSAHISPEDIAVTRHLTEILRKSAVTLVDHILIAGDRAVSMRETGVFMGLEIE